MSHNEYLSLFRASLEEALRHRDPVDLALDRLRGGPYVALSALQKSIRRGDEVLAQRSLDTLLEMGRSPWRRLSIIAFEDIGLGNIELLGWVVAAALNPEWRRTHGGDEVIAGFLARCMCRAVKDRSTDELVVLAEYDPKLAQDREEMVSLGHDDLLEFVTNQRTDMQRRALAIWYAAGTKALPASVLAPRTGKPRLLFKRYAEMALATACKALSAAPYPR